MKRILSLFAIVFALIALIIAKTTAQSGHSAKTKKYKVSIENARLFWRCDQHFGSVPFEKGSLTLSDGQIENGSFVLKMDSLKDADIDYKLMREVLENILRSKDFFHTEKYPFATFEVYHSELNKHGKGNLQGDLTLREVTKCITFGLTLRHEKDHLHIQTDTIKIDRTNWGILSLSPNHVLGNESFIVSDTIVISLSFNAIPE